MGYDYSQTYAKSKDALTFQRYRMSPDHQAIIEQEIWAILKVDEMAGNGFFDSVPIVELGIGGGAISGNIKTKFQRFNLVGVDVSRNMLDTCKLNLSHSSKVRGDSLILGNIFHLPFRSSSLNSVITVRLIPNLVENKLALKEIARILKPGGEVIFDIYNKMSVMSLLDSAIHLSSECKKKPYKHTCSLNQIIKTCESVGLPIKSQVKCLLFTEAFFKFLPQQLLRVTLLLDRIASRLPLLSKVSTRVFILSRKRSE